MAQAHCILGKFLGVGCHCFPSPLDVPTFSARCIHVQRRERPLAAEGGTLRGREMFRQISSRNRLPRNSSDLLHAANSCKLYFNKNWGFRCFWIMMQYIIVIWFGYGAVYFAKFGV
jgi:hypothetical protein